MVLAILASVGLVCPAPGTPGHTSLPFDSPFESTALARHAQDGGLFQLAKKLCSRQERTSPPEKAPWDGDGPGPDGIPVSGPSPRFIPSIHRQALQRVPGPARTHTGLAPEEGGRRGPPVDAQT